MNLVKKIFFVVFVFLETGVSLANNQVNNLLNNNDYFENQKKVFKEIENNSEERILFYDVKKPKVKNNVKSTKCFKIKKINSEMITLISKEEKNQIFLKYINKCNSIKDLKNLTNELSALYIEKGFITSKAFLKPQNISNEVIEISAIEGKIEKIKKNDFYLKNAFIGQLEKYLNLRDLEIAIENINRLPSNDAKLKLEPGSKIGLTIIDVDNKTNNRINGQISLNNYGQETTGEKQISFNASVDNPFQINDQISINYNTTDNHNKIENSIGNSINYSFPLGRILYTLSYSESKYNQVAKAQYNTYSIKGKSKTYKLNLNYKIYHNQNHKFSYKNFIKHYNTKKYIDETKIETSTYDLSQLGLGFTYLYQVPNYQTLISLDFLKGISLFSSLNPTELDTYYKKYNLNINFIKMFNPFHYNFTFYLQHSKDKLFSSEQISIGGPYSVRGYNAEGLNGNSGFYYRNQISYYIPHMIYSFSPSIYIGLDGGWIKKEEDTNGGTLLGEFIGFKLSSKSFSSDVYYSKALITEDVNKSKNFLGFNLSYNF